jgi:glutathione synthase/RimK-type ligase-like ATP-grasp enzyme
MNSKVLGVLFGKCLNHSKEDPLPNEKSSKDYALFTEIGRKSGLKVVVGSIRNVKGKLLTEAHEYSNGWEKIGDINLDVVLDRSFTSPKTNEIKKEINKSLPILNNPDLNLICWDKFSYKTLSPENIPITFLINSIDDLKKVLDKIPSDKIVIKPRYGIMGNDVVIVEKNKLPESIKENTIVQEFVDTSCGIKELKVNCVHDIRVILINNKIHHCYVRKATKGLLSNIAQGGIVEHIPNDKIPESIIKIVNDVIFKFKNYKHSLYSVDCIFSKESKPLMLEIESIPVIGSAYKESETKKIQEKFIDDILNVLKEMV